MFPNYDEYAELKKYVKRVMRMKCYNIVVKESMFIDDFLYAIDLKWSTQSKVNSNIVLIKLIDERLEINLTS